MISKGVNGLAYAHEEMQKQLKPKKLSEFGLKKTKDGKVIFEAYKKTDVSFLLGVSVISVMTILLAVFSSILFHNVSDVAKGALFLLFFLSTFFLAILGVLHLIKVPCFKMVVNRDVGLVKIKRSGQNDSDLSYPINNIKSLSYWDNRRSRDRTEKSEDMVFHLYAMEVKGGEKVTIGQYYFTLSSVSNMSKVSVKDQTVHKKIQELANVLKVPLKKEN
ncbi:MAG: hypothetical protein ACLFNR_01135 [Candidatus Paceibacterota bacterium]